MVKGTACGQTYCDYLKGTYKCKELFDVKAYIVENLGRTGGLALFVMVSFGWFRMIRKQNLDGQKKLQIICIF